MARPPAQEQFDFGATEALAGKAVVATDYVGTTDFITSQRHDWKVARIAPVMREFERRLPVGMDAEVCCGS